jgi:SAM-dependent methyltransferase
MNKVKSTNPQIKEILSVTNIKNFHNFFVKTSIKKLFKNKKAKITSILALGANHVEAETLIKFPFKKIILSGINEPEEKTRGIMKKDKRVSYLKKDIENINLPNGSIDFVFVKEALHHVSRPIRGLYEMLRVAKKGVIFIEPMETLLGRVLDKFGMVSNYEYDSSGKFRDNFVYRWRKKEIIKILNSYYLESGYEVEFKSCWMSNRFNNKFPKLVRIFNFLGWTASFIPGCEGNYLMCTIFPGKDLP